MHELAIARSLVAAVLEHTADQRVTAVRIRVGRLSGVVPDALDLAFRAAVVGTTLDGAALEIERSPGLASCRACGAEFGVSDLFVLCPCGSADVELVAGRELMLGSVQVV